MNNIGNIYSFLRAVVLAAAGLFLMVDLALAKVGNANSLMHAIALREASANKRAGLVRKGTQAQINALTKKSHAQIKAVKQKLKGKIAQERMKRIKLALIARVRALKAAMNTKTVTITRPVQAEKKVVLLHNRAATSSEIRAALALIENAMSINHKNLKVATVLIEKGQKVTSNQLEKEIGLEKEVRLNAEPKAEVLNIEKLQPVRVVAPVFAPRAAVLTYRQKVEALLDLMLFERIDLRPVALPANRDDLNHIRDVALMLIDRRGAPLALAADNAHIRLRVGVVQPFLSKANRVFNTQRAHGVELGEALDRVSFSEKLDTATGDKENFMLSGAQKDRLYHSLKTTINIIGDGGPTLQQAQDFVINMLTKTLVIDDPEGFATLRANPGCDFDPFVWAIMLMILDFRDAHNPQLFLDDTVKDWINGAARTRQQALRDFRVLKTDEIQTLNRDQRRPVGAELAYPDVNIDVAGDILGHNNVTMQQAHDAARAKFAELNNHGHLLGLDPEMFHSNPFLADMRSAEPRLAVIRAGIPGVANAHQNNGTEATFLGVFDAFKAAITAAVPPYDRIDDDSFDATFAIIRGSAPNRASLLARLKRLEESVRGRLDAAQAAKVVYDFAMKNAGRCPDGVAQGLMKEEITHVYVLPPQYADNLDVQVGIAFAKSLMEHFEKMIEDVVQGMFTIDTLNAALVQNGTAHTKLDDISANAFAGGDHAIVAAVGRVFARPAGIMPINPIQDPGNIAHFLPVQTRGYVLGEVHTYAKTYLHNALCYTLPLQGGHQPLVYTYNLKVNPNDFLEKLFRGGRLDGCYLASIQDNNGMIVTDVRINGSYNFQAFTFQHYVDLVLQNIRLPHDGDAPGPKSMFSDEVLTHMIHSDPVLRRKYDDMTENGDNDCFGADVLRRCIKAPAVERLVRRFSVAADRLDDIRLP